MEHDRWNRLLPNDRTLNRVFTRRLAFAAIACSRRIVQIVFCNVFVLQRISKISAKQRSFCRQTNPPALQNVLDLQTSTLQRRLPFGEESKILSFPCGPAKHLENTSITRRHILLSFVYYVTLCVRLCKALVYSLWIIFLNSSPIGLSRSRWEWLS